MGRKVNLDVMAKSLPARLELAQIADTKEIQNLGQEALVELQSRLGLGGVWGKMEIPLGWMPPGICSARGSRILDFQCNSREEIVCEGVNQLVILTLTRYALICFLVPTIGPTARGTLLAPTTISSCIKYLKKLVELALKSSSENNVGLFSRLKAQEPQLKRLGKKPLTELNRLLQFSARGYWSDIPIVVAESSQDSERQQAGSSVPFEAREPRTVPFVPFSDEFVGEAGWRMAWIVEHLGPMLLSCAETLAFHYRGLTSKCGTRHANESMRSGFAASFLSSYTWAYPDGKVLSELPFQLSLKIRGHGRQFAWPPKTHAELKCLLVLQTTAQMFVAFMSTGGRASETLSFEPGAIVESKNGGATISGRTYKLETMRGGRVRDWPIPDLGVLAIHQQERLARIAGEINLGVSNEDDEEDPSLPFDEELKLRESMKPSIWLRVGTGKPILGDYNMMLATAIEALGLTALSGGVNPHAHRFRKTVARLVALALVDAPKLLMDLFGHKTIEMTLHYILTDPLIRAEMQEVLKAQAIMLAEDAIGHIEQCGGPAAGKIRRAVEDARVRIGKDFGAKDIKDLAEIFTLSGKFWLLVRPGVICTKLPQQAGACNKNIGMPEPSKCRPGCEVRLEQAAFHEDVDRAIAQAFRFLEEAAQHNNEIGAEMWRGQVLANVDRFPGMRGKWAHKLAEFDFPIT